MTKNKFAVIDLGTNTFHILIVEIKDGQFVEILRKRLLSKLADDGIEYIGPIPFQRGLNALKQFKQLMLENNVKNYKVFGTAALRRAKNSPEFQKEVLLHTGIQIEIIDGSREAELIYRGVRLSIPMDKNPYLIMDIGGGSVEFIICTSEKLIWAESFPIGVAVLFHRFHQSDPISNKNLSEFISFLKTTLFPLQQALQKNPIQTLIGASGTFDVLEKALKGEQQKNGLHAKVPINNFDEFYDQVIKTDLAQRLAMEYIPDSRAELIVGAIILIKYILDISQTKNLLTSQYALKEGVISEYIEG